MQTIARHTRITEGREADYVRECQQIPEALDPVPRDAGVHSWRIWRDGRELSHLFEVEGYRAMGHQFAEDPANQRCQEHINQFLEVADSYEGEDDGIEQVWALPLGTPAGTDEAGEGRV